MTREPTAESTDSEVDTSANAATDSGGVGRGSAPWHYLVVLPTAELSVAGLALASVQVFGPTHSVTMVFGVFLIYATPVVGALSFAGLVLDGRRLTRRGERSPRWRWYAAATLAIAAVLTYHGTEERAFFGLWELGVALALAMVPVGGVYLLRRRFADRGL